MKYKYKFHQDPMDDDAHYKTYPLLNVTLRNGTNMISVSCLVDSGADISFFSTDIAHILGVDLTHLEIREITGIGNIDIQGRVAEVSIKLERFDKWITIDAVFIEDNGMPILGHSGFFENFEVTFRAYDNKFEVKSRKPKLFG
jgi:hypothetical protein